MIGDWPLLAVFAAAIIVILCALALYGLTRTDDALRRIRDLEQWQDRVTRKLADQSKPQTPAEHPERPQERPKPRSGSIRTPPQGSEGLTEALRGLEPAPPTQDIRAHAPPTAPIRTGDETPAQRRAREDEEALTAWRAEQTRRAARRAQEDK